ncbi:PGPGW domain-containing protein [Pontiella agarivorans]|uniref:PGPGW domain-containing protein n=1 Tax=Pontiella agarivorans TaxID=3038953 RepID=A0ABU5MUX5_9BACT|nr:PGPGW domain-containing protein [Pontiella agarivorans]MDZ8117943.1 PGPGW domain-containing protein [Pontiella agarivorans]
MKRLIWNRHTKLIAKHVAGWFCIIVGLIMCITPGQGLLTILLGVYLLADEIPLFGKIRDYLERRFPKAAAFVHRQRRKLTEKFGRKTTPDDPANDG